MTVGSVVVRAARRDDVEPILQLLQKVAEERRWLGTEPPLEVDDRRRRYLENLEPGAGGAAFVAVDEKQHIVGEISLWPADASTAVLGMIVAKRRRGQGIGFRLLEAAIAWAKRVRLRHLDLAVFPHNEAAIALYRKCGFVDVGLEKGAVARRNGELWDVLLMRRSL